MRDIQWNLCWLTAPVWFFSSKPPPGQKEPSHSSPFLGALTHHLPVGTLEVDDFPNFPQGYEMVSLVDLKFFLIICLWSLWMFSTMVWANDPRSKLIFRKTHSFQLEMYLFPPLNVLCFRNMCLKQVNVQTGKLRKKIAVITRPKRSIISGEKKCWIFD